MHPRLHVMAIVNDLFDEDLDLDYFESLLAEEALASAQGRPVADEVDTGPILPVLQ